MPESSALHPRLVIAASPLRIAGDGYTTVSLQTIRGALVSVTLRVTDSKLELVNQHGHAVRVHQDVILFKTSVSGVTDRLGSYHGRLHVTFSPAKPMVATILAQIRSGRRSASATAKVTVNPKAPAVSQAHRAER